MTDIAIAFDQYGTATAIYTEEIDLEDLGNIAQVKRASHVEPDGKGGWTADMAPVGGGVLGPFNKRSEALAAEVEWLKERLA